MNIGVNLYGPKTLLSEDFDGTTQKLKEIGIHTLEPCVLFLNMDECINSEQVKFYQENKHLFSGGIWLKSDAAKMLTRVRKAGFIVNSVHAMCDSKTPEQLLSSLPEMIEFGIKNKVKYYVISLMYGVQRMKEYLLVLKQMSTELAEKGILLAYHNHDMECVEEDGVTALDLVMESCPNMYLELDVGWVKFAGKNSVEWMQRYSDRLLLLHLKDITADAGKENKEQCFTAIGEGSIPLEDIMKEVNLCAIAENGIIIDQDRSNGDLIQDLAAGVQNINKY